MKIVVLAASLFSLFISGGEARQLTLESFFDLVAESHPLIQRENLNDDIEREKRNRYLSEEDWIFSAGPAYYHSDLVSTSSFSPERIDQLGLTASLRRKLWSTGGRFSVDLSSTAMDQKLPSFSLPFGGTESFSAGYSRFYDHAISVNFSQPLLRNFKGKLDRLEYELAEYDIDAAELISMESQEKLLYDLGNKYIDWVLLEAQLKIADERLRLSEIQLEQINAKYEANLVDKVDLLRSEDAVRKARQNSVLIKSRLTAQKAELSVQAQNQNITDMEPDFDLYKSHVHPSIENAYDNALEKSRPIKALEIRFRQLESGRRGFVETGRPDLDLSLGVGMKGGDRQFDNSLTLDKPDLFASLIFTKPIGNTAARIDIARTDLQLEQLRFEIEKYKLDLKSSISSLLIRISELENVLELNRREIESAALRTEEELKLYNQGRGDLSFVIQSQDNEENARLAYAENGADYQKLILAYKELTDTILSNSGVGQ